MDITYTMIGADGSHYGPVPLDQLKAWIAEGRVTAETKILRSDTQSWLPAANYPELDVTAAVAAPITPPPLPTTSSAPTRAYDPVLARRLHSGARWFFWIAALSLVNTFMAVAGTGGAFIIGTLGITGFIDAALVRSGGDRNAMLAVNVAVAGVFALFGVFAFKRQTWSFVVGGILYALDAMIFLLIQDWIVLAFHVFVLFWIFMGLKANLQLKALNR